MKSRSLLLCLCLFSACGGAAKLPPGLPPPEYEEPRVEPWPPASASAAPTAAPEAPPAASSAEPPLAPAAPAGGSGGSGASLSPGTP
jgi:hypothetical protein